MNVTQPRKHVTPFHFSFPKNERSEFFFFGSWFLVWGITNAITHALVMALQKTAKPAKHAFQDKRKGPHHDGGSQKPIGL
ncbi:hypothetical protein [Bifidobacterium dentium]|uniref:hypothetical protein n=1 Tax=Bifidobacterium dentium TaxID=1689 RepID=UPI001111AE90|nr:hypothetical protein [Bifidobacterium dentium]